MTDERVVEEDRDGVEKTETETRTVGQRMQER